MMLTYTASRPTRSLWAPKASTLTRCFSQTHRLLAVEPFDEIKLTQLDAKWTAKWRSISPNAELYPVAKDQVSSKNKKYIMSMFPYPSGMLHMGHVRVYTISDVIARFHRANGTSVIHPMGWDAFGLPAENAAVERNINPGVWTKQNIAKMKEQMNMILADFDWEREVTTCNPDYYKWTQKIFLLLHEEGLAYRKEAEINWDPVDQTVLANEQVDSQGRSWRSGAIVEKRLLNQWFLGITQFAHDLNHDLKTLDKWPSKVKAMQKHWIGESHGAEITFPSQDAESIKVFTTRPDTLLSVQYIALAIDNSLVRELAKSDPSLLEFITMAKDLPEESKAGYELKSISFTNPLSPSTKIPVFVAPYVIGSYGSGAVMGCPGHDDRDFAFWAENKPGETVIKTVSPTNPKNQIDPKDGPFTSEGILNSNAGEFASLTSKEAKSVIVARLNEQGLGKATIQYRIRDWLISRQRYWGAPIPIIHCESCGDVPVPDSDLPVLLPDDAKIVGKGNPLETLESFVNVPCPSCGKDAKRDTDTMDTFMDSSWYYFRYTDPQNTLAPFDFNKATNALPVDIYIGGIEHAILHLLYSRFIAKFLWKKGLWDGSESLGEPFKQLVTQGMVHGKTYINPENGRFLKPDELDLTNPQQPKIVANGLTPDIAYEKMSKSKYNGADPSECIVSHGADATRAHMLFQAPISDVLVWDESKIVGIERWLRRLIQLSKQVPERITEDRAIPQRLNEQEIKFHNETEMLLKSITDSFSESLSLNTVISDYMKFTRSIFNALDNDQVNINLTLKQLKKLIVAVSPVTPASAEEAWEMLCGELNVPWTTVFSEPWPELEPIRESNLMVYNVFINGKMRFTHEAMKDFYTDDENAIMNILMAREEGKKFFEGKTLKKLICKPRAISFIVV